MTQADASVAGKIITFSEYALTDSQREPGCRFPALVPRESQVSAWSQSPGRARVLRHMSGNAALA